MVRALLEAGLVGSPQNRGLDGLACRHPQNGADGTGGEVVVSSRSWLLVAGRIQRISDERPNSPHSRLALLFGKAM